MRQRATAIILKEGNVLLVKDKGHSKYSLPVGGIKKGEPVISAVNREIYEELGLTAGKVTRLRSCDFVGSLSQHKVCLIEVSGELHIKGHELVKSIWWDMKKDIPIYANVRYIIEKM